jgi:S1-C subfamily serine protease
MGGRNNVKTAGMSRPGRLLALPSLVLFAVLAGAVAPSRAADGSRAIERSVIQITTFGQRARWDTPWAMGQLQGGGGTGFLIDRRRILTNAHVVSDARVIQVRRFQDANPYLARVEHVGHDCDLALLVVDDPAFYEGLKPMTLTRRLPALRTKVRTYGYPSGGRELSSTEGVVSRIEYQRYAHTGNDSHLTVQTDAAINPGNSGGPVILDGRVVGVAFQSIPGLNDVGFFIPYQIIEHFLEDVKDNKYDGFSDLGIRWSQLQSPAYRRQLGMPDGLSGVVVDQVLPGSAVDGVLLPRDVIVQMDRVGVANDGTVPLGEHRVDFVHPMEERQVGEQMPLTVWRAGARRTLRATLGRYEPFDRSRRRYDELPRYYVYAGLVFMPVDQELLMTWGRNWIGKAPKSVAWNHLYRGLERPERMFDETVVLVRRLKDTVNSTLPCGVDLVVESVNGRPIRRLTDLVAAFEEHQGSRHLMRFEDGVCKTALDRAAADAAHARILETYGIPDDRRL